MSVTKDKFLLFRSHECSRGLSDEAVQEISDAAELLEYDSGEYLHHANQAMTFACFVVHGRLQQAIVDMHGNILSKRFLTRGSQFGALAAAQDEPVPVDVFAVEPSAVLRLDYETTFTFTRKFDAFGRNIARSIAKMVRQALLSERKHREQSLVTVFHDSPTSRPLTVRLVQRLSELDESLGLMSDQSLWEPIKDVAFRPLMENGRPLTREEIRRQISLWSDFPRVILEIDASLDPADASQLVAFSDQVIWCGDVNNVEQSLRRLRAIEAKAPGWRDKINFVWLLDDDNDWVAPFSPELSDLVARDFKISFSTPHSTQSRALVNGFERLVHHLRGIRIGIALGGGGARGMAHLGVLKALEQSGIVVDMIAGTSAGAMTGIINSAGLDVDYSVKQFAEDLRPEWPFRILPRGSHWYLLHKYRRGLFDPMLRKYLSDWKLEQLPLPVQSVTVDLVTGKPVVRDRGDAVHAILESINLPVMSTPIWRNGQALVDGGLVNNIPADVLVNNGCNFVIAVSVTAHLEPEFARNRPDTPSSAKKSASTFQTLLRSFLVQSVNMNSVGVEPADVVIEPDVTGFELSEFSRTDELAAVGEIAALEVIPKIGLLLRQIDPELFKSVG